ncbi:hypothetical protein J113_17525 [Mycobacterium tuberculosis CAS/NITR204]|uniref:Uncharacterized protein n=1 Tax=Mycobacterium tuberculosis CAS/NITR204 TaxID=1310114 RepID=R4MAX4_MYCTX|nr:hypothetical protein J113_17525 [Mycobacterium tuberculosis CAS/NITR204]
MMTAVMIGAVACGSGRGPAPIKVIADKGTPFADLLVPKLTASVTDGAVGVTVDAPVSVTAADGVLAAVPWSTTTAGRCRAARRTALVDH